MEISAGTFKDIEAITETPEYVGPEEEMSFVLRNCRKIRMRESNQIYIFNPEHDLCIANGDENFVPPRSAVGMESPSRGRTIKHLLLGSCLWLRHCYDKACPH